MKRFSNLNKLNVEEEIVIVQKLISFFHPMKNLEKRNQLGLSPANGIMPLGLKDFFEYEKKINKIDLYNNQNNILSIVNQLSEKGYLRYAGSKGNFMAGLEKTYHFLKEFTTLQSKGNYWLSEILGLPFLAHYTNPIIIHILGKTKDNEEHGGTGILINNDTILTCAHVLTDMSIYPMQTVGNKVVNVVECKYHDNIDVGYIKITPKFNCQNYSGLGLLDPQILQNILIIGYPPIPCADNAYTVIQKGEVNSFISNYTDSNNYFLFSSITRPGNSGGPIFSENGYLIGLVSRELSDKQNFPFHAGIPAKEILKAIKELDSNIEITYEDFQ